MYQESTVTVWSTADEKKPLCVIKNMFENEVLDVTWGGVYIYLYYICMYVCMHVCIYHIVFRMLTCIIYIHRCTATLSQRAVVMALWRLFS
jgi:hypothetical protein